MARELELGMDKVEQPATTEPATPATEPQAEELAKTEPAQNLAEQTDGQQAPPAETGEAETDPEPESKRVPLAALKQERERRKKEAEKTRKLEEELAFYRGQLEALNKPKDGPQEKVPTREEIEQRFFSDPVSYVEEQVKSAIETTKHHLAVQRAHESEERARRTYEDFDEVFKEFQVEFSKAPPQLRDRVVANLKEQPDPAAYIYNQIKTARAVKESGGSVEGMRAQIEKQVREEYEKKMKQAGTASALSAIPKTKVGSPGAGAPPSAPARSADKWNDMFSRKPF